MPSQATIKKVHRIAGEAIVLRALLRVEDAQTYQAVKLKPALKPLAGHIRAQTKVMEDLCTAIIRDDTRISTIERRLRAAHGSSSPVDPSQLLNQKIADVGAKAQALASPRPPSQSEIVELNLVVQQRTNLLQLSSAITKNVLDFQKTIVNNAEGLA